MDFLHAGFLVDPKFAARFPFEVFDRICNVDLAPINLGFLKALIQQLSCRPNKRTSFFVFLFPGCSPIIMMATLGLFKPAPVSSSPKTA